MKSKKINPIDIQPETIAEISEEQAQSVEGGGSCNKLTCNPTN